MKKKKKIEEMDGSEPWNFFVADRRCRRGKLWFCRSAPFNLNIIIIFLLLSNKRNSYFFSTKNFINLTKHPNIQVFVFRYFFLSHLLSPPQIINFFLAVIFSFYLLQFLLLPYSSISSFFFPLLKISTP